MQCELVSVPYALHSKTAESITGTISETDPVFVTWDKSTGISITKSQISDLTHTVDTDTQLSDADIATMGYIKIADDADADASNEFQTITRTGTTVTLSNGGGT